MTAKLTEVDNEGISNKALTAKLTEENEGIANKAMTAKLTEENEK